MLTPKVLERIVDALNVWSCFGAYTLEGATLAQNSTLIVLCVCANIDTTVVRQRERDK